MKHTVRFLTENITVCTESGSTILQAQIQAGLHPDAPCGGNGTCGKCRVRLEDGTSVLACRTSVCSDITVYSTAKGTARILLDGQSVSVVPDGEHHYVLAFDIGTTTVVGFLLNGTTGQVLAKEGILNPQRQYGADVISRIQAARTHSAELQLLILNGLNSLTKSLTAQAGLIPEDITAAAIAGNTAMHHLLLGIDPKPLVTPPYMPTVKEAMEVDLLPITGKTRMLPNIAGFVGGDTAACMLAARLDQTPELTLLVDIGTNGEMVLGNGSHRIACSTAAGPAFEGARISCGMRGAEGAIDHVYLKDGQISFHVIGDVPAIGICGSGLLDLLAVLLEAGIMDESGRLPGGKYALTDTVCILQKDIQEVQMAKAAIRAGITMLAQRMGMQIPAIQKVLLAGAFGNYLNPASACRIGMFPPELLDRIQPVGNAAGVGACMCALNRDTYNLASKLTAQTEFLELGGMEEFQDCFLDALDFSSDAID